MYIFLEEFDLFYKHTHTHTCACIHTTHSEIQIQPSVCLFVATPGVGAVELVNTPSQSVHRDSKHKCLGSNEQQTQVPGKQ